MVVDSSALAAILFGEPERRQFIEAIESADARLLSVANWVEISIVVEARHGAEGVRDLERFIDLAGLELVPVDAEQGRVARDAWVRFGKGRHRAALNFGDCFAYALAKSAGHVLLFKGEDFTHTDLVAATG